MSEQLLLKPVKLGRYELNNRVVMAPMTRDRADNPDLAPTALHALYYGQRATAGLIVTEGSQISPQGTGYINTPGIYSAAQIEGWKKVTEAVHAEGGHIFLQLWHVGAISHPDFHGGALPVSASAFNPKSKAYTPAGELKETVTARALEVHEIEAVVRDFAQGAKNAIAAGFDGVEIHGANSYLIEQFLRDSSNARTDGYGGSIANRARFLFEVVEAVGRAVGFDRTGLRLSPANTWNVPADSDSRALYDYVIAKLSDYGLAYLHLRDPAGDVSAIPNMVANVTEHYRRIYKGTLITNTGYTRETGNAAVAEGRADLVAFGVPFIANPDLVERFRAGAELAKPDQTTFYTPGEKGYVDYPALQAQAA
ncbi:MAG TPA: alkene reductase [Gammaproteobacteria bacterium]|nr:alkene reductase [Gammaproteobacteria bacterium]